MQKKRRLLIMASKFPNRSETFVMQHVSGMIDRGYEVSVLANSTDPAAWDSITQYQEELKNRVFLSNMPTKKTSRILGVLKLLFKNMFIGRFQYLRSFNFFRFGKSCLNLTLPYVYDVALELGHFDIIHCHFGPVGVLGANLKQLGLSEKLVVTFHGYDLSMVLQKNTRRHPYENLFIESDLILPISETWRRKLSEIGAPIERMTVHRVGIDLSSFIFSEKNIRRAKSLKIVSTARCVEKKGLKYGIEAVARVKANYPNLDVKYELIGDGPLFDELVSMARQLGVSDSITFHGSMSHSKVRSILSSSDLFMLPSVTSRNGDQEGIPVAIMEAMALGVIVLSTEHSGIPELVEHGKSGYLVPEKDSNALAVGINFFATHSNTLSLMRNAARAKVELEHDLQFQNDSLVRHYEKLFNSATVGGC